MSFQHIWGPYFCRPITTLDWFRMFSFLILLLVNEIAAQSRYPVIFPPSVATAASTSTAGAWYGNGTYSYAASASASTSLAAWRAFDNNTSTNWLSNTSYPSGNYNGSTSLLGHSGEWIQISIPVNITLSQFSIRCAPSASTLCPSNLVVAASNSTSLTVWAIVSQQTGLNSWSSNPTTNFTVSSNSTFSTYRFIFKSANSQAGSTQIAISEVSLLGIERKLMHISVNWILMIIIASISTSMYSARLNPIREFPPNDGSIPRGNLWTKDLNDVWIPKQNPNAGVSLAKYKFDMLSSYAPGQYAAFSDAIYGYSANTDYGWDEWPASGPFDKLPATSFSYSGWNTGMFSDRTTVRNLYLQLPTPILLLSYSIESRYDCCTNENPSSWLIYGSNDGQNWTTLDTRSGISWSLGQVSTYTLSSIPINLFTIYRFASPNVDSLAEIRYFGQLVNDSTPSNKKYPASSATGAGTLVYNQAFGNGQFNVLGSSVFNSSTFAHLAFDATSKDWISAQNMYRTNGTYSGTKSTTVGGVSVFGEWVQVSFSHLLNVTNFQMVADPLFAAPSSFLMVGSMDSTTWESIFSVTNETTWSAQTSRSLIYSVSAPKSFKAFRFILRNATSSPLNGAVALSEIMLYGLESPSTSFV